MITPLSILLKKNRDISNKTKSHFTIVFTILLFLIFLSTMIKTKKLQMIYPIISSNDVPLLQISSAHILKEILEKQKFTIFLEYNISGNINLLIPEIQINNFDILKSQFEYVEKVDIVFTINQGSITLQNSNLIFGVNPLHISLIRTEVTLKILFSFEIDLVQNRISAFIHFFSPSLTSITSSHQRYLLATNFLSKNQVSFFKINMLVPNTTTTIKNVLAIEGTIDYLQPETFFIFGGFASLIHSIYFYMEPTNTKFLMNRSKFNLPSAINGLNHGYAGKFFSRFSPQTGQVEWMMATNNHEFLFLDIGFIDFEGSWNYSFFVRFKIFLRNDDVNGYFASIRDPEMNLMGLGYAAGNNFNYVVQVKVRLDSLASSGNMISCKYSIVVYNEADDAVLILPIEKDFDISNPNDLLFDSNALQLIIYSPKFTEIYIQIILYSKENKKTQISEIYNLNPPTTITKFDKLVIGQYHLDYNYLYPSFLITLHDFQIFTGSFFVSSLDDDDLLISFSKMDTHQVYCKSNSYLNRPSNNQLLDSIYNDQFSKNPLCKNRKFGENCEVSNCEICAISICLVCAIPFYLENGLCVDGSSELDQMDYDVFNHQLIPFSKATSFMNKELKKGKKIQMVSNNEMEYFVFQIDLASIGIKKQTIRIRYDWHTNFVNNPNNLNQIIRERLFGNATKITSYFFSKCGVSNFPFYSTDFLVTIKAHVYKSTQVCSNTDKLIYNSYRSMYCNQNSSSTSMDYYTQSIDNLMEENTYISYVNFDVKYDTSYPLIMKCKNNCDCSSAPTPNECPINQSCPSNYGLILFLNQPKVSSCEKCESGCLSCKGNLCLKWENSKEFFSNAYTLEMYPDFIFYSKIECHKKCKLGCTGQTITNCKECSNSCAFCNADFKCKCHNHPHLKFVAYNEEFDSCEFSFCFDNCAICSNLGKCKMCKKDYEMIDQSCKKSEILNQNCSKKGKKSCLICRYGYIKVINLCVKCPSNCLSCKYSENEKVICQKCIFGFVLSPQKKCFRLPVQLRNPQRKLFLTEISNDYKTIIISSFLSECQAQYFGFVDKSSLSQKLYKNNICEIKKKKQNNCNLSFKGFIMKKNKCKSNTFFNPKIKKYSKCLDFNCLKCDARKCITCNDNHVAYQFHCLFCPTSNCKNCSKNGTCTKCLDSFKLTKKNVCLWCSMYCEECENHSICLKCKDGYQKVYISPEKIICREKCISKIRLNYPPFYCLKCESCFCYNHINNSISCPECPNCKKKCSILWSYPTANILHIFSEDIIFSKTTKIKFEPEFESEVIILPDNSIKIILQPYHKIKKLKIFRNSFSSKNCLTNIDFEMNFNGSINHLLDLSKIFSIYENIATLLELFVALFSGLFLNFEPSSFLHLLNLNKMFNYTFIFGKNKNNLIHTITYYTSKRKYEKLIHIPLSKNRFVYFSEELNEKNYFIQEFMCIIFYQSIVLFFFICIFMILEIEFFTRCKQRNIQKFEEAKNKKDINICSSMLKRLDENKQRAIFIWFISISPQLSHIAAKLIRCIKMEDNNFSLLLLTFLVNFMLFFFIIYFSCRYIKAKQRIKNKKREYQKKVMEYITLSKSIVTNINQIYTIYMLILLNESIDSEYILMIIISLHFLSIYIEYKIICIFQPLYLVRSLILMVPFLCVCINTLGENQLSNILLSFYWIVGNFGIVFIAFYEIIFKINEKIKDSILNIKKN